MGLEIKEIQELELLRDVRFNSRERNKLKAIRRRIEHLTERLSHWNTACDKGRTEVELSALRWFEEIVVGGNHEDTLSNAINRASKVKKY